MARTSLAVRGRPLAGLWQGDPTDAGWAAVTPDARAHSCQNRQYGPIRGTGGAGDGRHTMMTVMSASEFGHAIGVPGPRAPQPVYQPTYPPAPFAPPPASYPTASYDDELDLSTMHAQAR